MQISNIRLRLQSSTYSNITTEHFTNPQNESVPLGQTVSDRWRSNQPLDQSATVSDTSDRPRVTSLSAGAARSICQPGRICRTAPPLISLNFSSKSSQVLGKCTGWAWKSDDLFWWAPFCLSFPSGDDLYSSITNSIGLLIQCLSKDTNIHHKQQSFLVTAPRVWNGLPLNVISQDSIKSFKKNTRNSSECHFTISKTSSSFYCH